MDQLLKRFRDKYNTVNKNDIRFVKSPLRICPLGAHVDHQHGLVTGMAIDSAVNMVYSLNEDGYIRIQSLDFPDEEYFHIEHVPDQVPGFWGNYLRGAVLSLKQDHLIKKGFNAIISGKLPIGGLSSSAAVTSAYLIALADVNNVLTSKEDLIQYSHWVENKYIGLNNGILDQSANILSKNGYLMYMDTKTGKYELIPKAVEMPDYEIIIVYSGLSKALIGTDYNNRVDECRVSAWILQDLAHKEIASLKETRLREVDYDTYLQFREELPERFRKRADHFFGENQRVKEGIEAWKHGDLINFGRLMFESGESSINNYESGCPELISIFNILKEAPGVYGARFSGAGYRGCCIGLVNPTYKEQLQAVIDQEYPKRHPEYKELYKVHFSRTNDGARIVKGKS